MATKVGNKQTNMNIKECDTGHEDVSRKRDSSSVLNSTEHMNKLKRDKCPSDLTSRRSTVTLTGVISVMYEARRMLWKTEGILRKCRQCLKPILRFSS